MNPQLHTAAYAACVASLAIITTLSVVALQAAQQGQKRRPGDADLSLLVRQLEIDIAVSKSFDEADANLATDPKAVYEGLGEKIVQLSDDSPLQERAARLIGKAKELTVTRHLDDADRALKRLAHCIASAISSVFIKRAASSRSAIACCCSPGTAWFAATLSQP